MFLGIHKENKKGKRERISEKMSVNSSLSWDDGWTWPLPNSTSSWTPCVDLYSVSPSLVREVIWLCDTCPSGLAKDSPVCVTHSLLNKNMAGSSLGWRNTEQASPNMAAVVLCKTLLVLKWQGFVSCQRRAGGQQESVLVEPGGFWLLNTAWRSSQIKKRGKSTLRGRTHLQYFGNNHRNCWPYVWNRQLQILSNRPHFSP